MNSYDIDRLNSMTYKRVLNHGAYICSCCGGITTLDNSVSSQGYNLVCNDCRYKMSDILGIDNDVLLIHRVGEKRRKLCTRLL